MYIDHKLYNKVCKLMRQGLFLQRNYLTIYKIFSHNLNIINVYTV